MKKNGKFAVLLGLTTLMLVSCNNQESQTDVTYTVFTETYENTIEISGNISAAEQQQMTASSSGTIEKVYFKEGDIRKGTG